MNSKEGAEMKWGKLFFIFLIGLCCILNYTTSELIDIKKLTANKFKTLEHQQSRIDSSYVDSKSNDEILKNEKQDISANEVFTKKQFKRFNVIVSTLFLLQLVFSILLLFIKKIHLILRMAPLFSYLYFVYFKTVFILY